MTEKTAFCRHCGEPMHEENIVCSECGSRQTAPNEIGTSTSRTEQTQSQHERTDSASHSPPSPTSLGIREKIEHGDHWGNVKLSFFGGIICTAIGWITFVLVLADGSSISASLFFVPVILIFAGIAAWVVWSYSIYKDAQYVRERVRWQPDPFLMGVGSLFIAIVGWYYMIRRARITSAL